MHRQGPLRKTIIILSQIAAKDHHGEDVCKNHCHHQKYADQIRKTDLPLVKNDPEKRGYVLERIASSERRCCVGCSMAGGYLTKQQITTVIKELGIFPTERDGFLELGVGCRLPRSHRSNTCLRYKCSSMEKHAPSAYKKLEAAWALPTNDSWSR